LQRRYQESVPNSHTLPVLGLPALAHSGNALAALNALEKRTTKAYEGGLTQILSDNGESATDASLRTDAKCRQAGSLMVHTLFDQHLADGHTNNGKVS
jgi:hypothetical protein